MCMVYSFVATGNVEKDVREESDSEPDETTGGSGDDHAARSLDASMDKAGKEAARLEGAGEMSDLRHRRPSAAEESASSGSSSRTQRASNKKSKQ